MPIEQWWIGGECSVFGTRSEVSAGLVVCDQCDEPIFGSRGNVVLGFAVPIFVHKGACDKAWTEAHTEDGVVCTEEISRWSADMAHNVALDVRPRTLRRDDERRRIEGRPMTATSGAGLAHLSPRTLHDLAAAIEARTPRIRARRALTAEGIERLADILLAGTAPTVGFYRRYTRAEAQ